MLRCRHIVLLYLFSLMTLAQNVVVWSAVDIFTYHFPLYCATIYLDPSVFCQKSTHHTAMSLKKIDSFKDLKTGKYDWKVPGRMLSIWRGSTRTGVVFKSFNMLLMDNKVMLLQILFIVLDHQNTILLLTQCLFDYVAGV